jgi:sec-independent protein translocase protein TatA
MFGLDNIGMPEIIVVAVVLLIIFGPKKLPELAKGISDAIKEIKKSFGGEEEKTVKTEKKKK